VFPGSGARFTTVTASCHQCVARLPACATFHQRFSVVPGQIEASTRSTNKSFKKLIAEKLATPETIYDTICNQTVDLVLTAHPTQVGMIIRTHSLPVTMRPHSHRFPPRLGFLAVLPNSQQLFDGGSGRP